MNSGFHRALYLGLQRVRGRPVGAYIQQLQQWERLDPAAFQRLRTQRTMDTLSYARQHVPLYRSAPWRQARSGVLESWPMLDRDTVQRQGPDLLAQPSPKGIYLRQTSGSTGKPLQVGIDPTAAAWARAGDLRGLLWHGIRLGSPCLSIMGKRESALLEWVRNTKAFEAGNLSDTQLDEAVRHLRARHPTFLWGYVSAIVELARHVRQNAPTAGLPLARFAMVYGEMLYPFQREEIKWGLGARVIGTYGCNETGTVAFECPAGSLHVFSEHVEVEIVNDGQIVERGEMGEILLTCLTNRAMPLVRYRVGDRGRLSPDPCSCGRPHPVLSDIQGRIGDVLLTASGQRVHGTAALGAILKRIHATAPELAIRQTLFEQHDPLTWRVLVQPGPAFGDETAAELEKAVRAIFGEQCTVRVEVVNEIPREPSGKFRFYRVAPAPPPAE